MAIFNLTPDPNNFVYTPKKSVYSKVSPGLSDVTHDGQEYKFLGCSIVNVSQTQGFNGTPSSLSVTLVEDTANGQVFERPDVPSLKAFSLPKGGVGAKIFYPGGTDLNPDQFYPENVPFYFCGVIAGWKEDTINVSGRTITVEMVDVRELMRGIQVLCGSFALTQQIGAAASEEQQPLFGLYLPRFQSVDNVIDAFGFYNFGMESNANDYGMEWSKIEQAIESVQTQLFGIKLEFNFSGTAFTGAPSFYRIKADIIDMMSLIQKVAEDGGSDFVIVARKVSADTAVVEIRAIRRSNTDDLTKTEISTFISNRSDIVSTASVGKEFRNEPTSQVIIGGRRNKMYVAWPSHVCPTFRADGIESWPPRMETRLFGGNYTTGHGQGRSIDDANDPELPKIDYQEELRIANMTDRIGSIFPFWGFGPDNQDPLLDPFLPLDHLSFFSDEVQGKIPLVKLTKVFKNVRTIKDIVQGVNLQGETTTNTGELKHMEMFLSTDRNADTRPFTKVSEWKINPTRQTGWIRGLPLNDEILRASLVSEELFQMIYGIHFPDIAEKMGFLRFNEDAFVSVFNKKKAEYSKSLAASSATLETLRAMDMSQFVGQERINKNNQGEAATVTGEVVAFRSLIWEMVRNYAQKYMGKSYIVCLPASRIMNRIFTNQPVPTRKEKPEIEYVVDNIGYFETLPQEFDGLATTTRQFNDEKQIREKFMSEDGRFSSMAVIKRKPKGNMSFASDGTNQILLHELGDTEFRPNRIAEASPERVFVSCSVRQLVKRPDLALVNLPNSVHYDPLDDLKHTTNDASRTTPLDDDLIIPEEKLAALTDRNTWKFATGPFYKFFWTLFKRAKSLNDILYPADTSIMDDDKRDQVYMDWAEDCVTHINRQNNLLFASEINMDVEAIMIPLTSTWVTYGPWYEDNSVAQQMVGVQTDDTLVPWNFERPNASDSEFLINGTGAEWDDNLEAAGQERLERTLSLIDSVDSANIVVAGFPEFGPAQGFGFNSNLTNISVNFGIGGVTTTYTLSTYAQKPGSYRKSDYDQIANHNFRFRPEVTPTRNINLTSLDQGTGIGTEFGSNPFNRQG